MIVRLDPVYHFMGSLCLASTLLLLSACGPARIPTGEVSGTILSGGNPLSEGDVNFYMAERGIGAIAPVDASGHFAFSQPMETGTYAVYVTPLRPVPGLPPSPESPLRGIPTKKRNREIPRKCRNPETSGLSFTVNEGKNDCTIDLKN